MPSPWAFGEEYSIIILLYFRIVLLLKPDKPVSDKPNRLFRHLHHNVIGIIRIANYL